MKCFAKCLAFPIGVGVLLWAGQASAVPIAINIDTVASMDPICCGGAPVSVVLGSGDDRLTPTNHLIPADALLSAIFTTRDDEEASRPWIAWAR